MEYKFTALDVISDKEGRWVIVSGELQNNKITLVNLYSLNVAQANFVSLLNIPITQFQNTPLLVGGDYNLANGALVDHSGHPTSYQQINLSQEPSTSYYKHNH